MNLDLLLRGNRGPLLIALVSFVVVGSAFASQYIGGLNPCRLCWYQRIPYGITIVVGLIAAPAGRSAEHEVGGDKAAGDREYEPCREHPQVPLDKEVHRLAEPAQQ